MTTEEVEARRRQAFAEYWEARTWLHETISRDLAEAIYDHGWLDRGLAEVEQSLKDDI